MNPHKHPFAMEAVLEGFTSLRNVPFRKPSTRKFYLILLALLISGGITAGVWQLSANGDISVLKQRLVGQVHLSTGTYSARTLEDLNQASWNNGLEILETLDALNLTLATLETMQANPQINAKKLRTTQASMEHTLDKVRVLLRDRKAIAKSAQILKAKNLYAPVYKEYLTSTLARVSALQEQAHAVKP